MSTLYPHFSQLKLHIRTKRIIWQVGSSENTIPISPTIPPLTSLTHIFCGHILPLQSNVFIYSISSGASSKSKIAKFSANLCLLDDFGMTAFPNWTFHLIRICAGVLLYLAAICLILVSLRTSGSPGFCHGLEGDPRGLYEVIVIPLARQNSRNFFWFK